MFSIVSLLSTTSVNAEFVPWVTASGELAVESEDAIPLADGSWLLEADATAGVVEVRFADAIDESGAEWSIEASHTDGRASVAWTADERGGVVAWLAVGQTYEIALAATSEKGATTKPTYGPVITIKPKG